MSRWVLRLAIGGVAACSWALSGASQTHRVVKISPPDGVNANEVSVAINPKDENNIVAVAMLRGYQGRGGFSNYAFYSLDGGATWQCSAAPNPRDRTQGDDALRFTAEGVAIRSYISFLGIFEPRPQRAETAICLSRSSDGGATWGEPVSVMEHLNTGEPMEDKPYPVVDNHPQSPHFGHVYIAWTRFDRYGSSDPEDNTQIYFSRSTDGGETFAPPYRISEQGGDCLDSDNTVEGAVAAVGVGGEVYVAWAGPRGIEFTQSTDGGVHFEPERVIFDMPGGWDSPVDGVGRHNGMPVTGVDASSGPHRGSLYLNWIDERNGDLDVFVANSRDGGKTWSSPVRVNDDPPDGKRTQFFTWMAIDPLDGSIQTIFYDQRQSDGRRARLTLARSVDGGATFRNYPIDLPEFELRPNIFMGDYSGIDARNGKVVAAFAHFTGDQKQTAISAAIFHFPLGELEPIPPQ